jgi:hypothetical protein
MTPRKKRVFMNGALRASVSMPTFAIHSREVSPPVVNVDDILAQMAREDAVADAKRPITNCTR